VNLAKTLKNYKVLPSDKRGTPHFHQFGELTAEKRFFCKHEHFDAFYNEYVH
jgi:hypothetical protein